MRLWITKWTFKLDIYELSANCMNNKAKREHWHGHSTQNVLKTARQVLWVFLTNLGNMLFLGGSAPHNLTSCRSVFDKLQR